MRVLLALALVISAHCNLAAAPIRAVITENGSFVESFEGVSGPSRRGTLDDPQVLWSRHEASAVFQGSAVRSGFAYSGSELNDPREAAWYEAEGNGIPGGVVTGTEWRVAAGMYVWAAVDRSDETDATTLYVMPENSTDPTFTYDLEDGFPSGTDALQFSSQSNRLAVWMGRPSQAPRLLSWDPDNGDLFEYVPDDSASGSARAMQMTPDGSLIAVTAGPWCHVLSVDDSTVRDIFNTGASTSGLAISEDGDYILTAFDAITCWHWNGVEYETAWTIGIGSRYCTQLWIAPDNDYAVSCWNWSNYSHNYIRLHNLESGTTIWSYDFNHGGTELQDQIIDIDGSFDGNWFAVGCWGNANNANGEVVVFNRWYNEPYYELDMPGSCFTMDLSPLGDQLVAGGKAVHANVMGSGGDFYCVDLDPPEIEPLPEIVDTMLTHPDTLCLCQDTVTVSIRMTNTGYDPCTILHVAFGVPLEDNSYVALDSTILGQELIPGDTMEIRFDYSPCGVLAGEVVVNISTEVGTFVTLFTAHVIPCPDAADDLLPVHPSSFRLHACYPNPFNSTATIRFEIPSRQAVSLRLYDVMGRLAADLVDDDLPAGSHRAVLDANSLASGIYLLRLETNLGSFTHKAVLIR